MEGGGETAEPSVDVLPPWEDKLVLLIRGLGTGG